MWARKSLSVLFGAVLAFCVFLPAAHADEHNQMTELSFSQPVRVPHECLPAGSYWFVLASGPNRNVVQVFSSDWSKEYANLITVPTIRAAATTRTEVTFAETPATQPEALLKWYYPGRLTGHEFLYSPQRENLFAHEGQQNMVVAMTLKTRS